MPKTSARTRPIKAPFKVYEGPLGPTREFRLPLPVKSAAAFVRYAEFAERPVDLVVAEALQDYADVVIATRMCELIHEVRAA